jgi:hypothetical protein
MVDELDLLSGGESFVAHGLVREFQRTGGKYHYPAYTCKTGSQVLTAVVLGYRLPDVRVSRLVTWLSDVARMLVDAVCRYHISTGL